MRALLFSLFHPVFLFIYVVIFAGLGSCMPLAIGVSIWMFSSIFCVLLGEDLGAKWLEFLGQLLFGVPVAIVGVLLVIIYTLG